MLSAGFGEEGELGGTAVVAAWTVGSGLDPSRLSWESWLSTLRRSAVLSPSWALSPLLAVATRSWS